MSGMVRRPSEILVKLSCETLIHSMPKTAPCSGSEMHFSFTVVWHFTGILGKAVVAAKDSKLR